MGKACLGLLPLLGRSITQSHRGRLAQLAEQLTLNQRVQGSNP